MSLPRLSRRVPRPLRWAVGVGIALAGGWLAQGAVAAGATPSYPTISGPSSGSGGVAVAVSVGNFTLSDASASGNACGISSVRAVMTTDLGTINVSNAGGATVTGSRTATVTMSGTVSQVEAALDSASVTAASAGTATVTTTFRPSDSFTAGGYDYVFSTTTGHYYRRDSNGGSVTWGSARTHAAAQTFCGADGYLATFTSADENSTSMQLLASYADTAYWVGGIRSSSAADPAGNPGTGATDYWYWDPGTNAPSSEQQARVSYGDPGLPPYTTGQTPWHVGQPSGNGPALVISPTGSPAVYKWDDVPVDQSGVSYGLAEFGNNTSYTIASTTTSLTLTRPACTQTTTYNNNIAFVTFTGAGCSGSWTRPNADITQVTLIVAGGGGGGGYQGGGGGSGGGVIALGWPTPNYGITGSSYAVTIGGGGAGATSLDTTGGSGYSTTFGSLTALGGAGGGSHDNDGASGPSGGGAGSSSSQRSGGSASYATDTNVGGLSTTGAGTSSSNTFGLVGAANNVSYPNFGAGGGGAFGNAATSSAAGPQPGTGGAGYGLSSFSTANAIPLIPYSPTSTIATWASGGGGGRDDASSMTGSNSASGYNSTYSTAGGGGGGNRAGQNGMPNSGNGGGGGGRASTGYGNGGDGASGMVMLRFDVTPAWRTGSTAYDGQVPDAYTTTNTVNDLAFGRSGTSYSQFAFVQKGVGESVDDWSYSVSSGSLPPGLTLTEVGLRKVEISGTPTTAGTYTFSLMATDNEAQTTDAVYSFRIAITGITQPSITFAWPLASSITIAGPSDLSGGWNAGVCLYASDASGNASGSLRFDIGTKGSAQSSISAGSGTVTVTNDYAYGSLFLAGATTENVLTLLSQADAITITRANFRTTFYFTVRYVPYFPGASVSCSTAVGSTGVQQVVEVRSLGASFVDEFPVSVS
ncbi:MAG: hypothetical protein RL383_1242 [Actinomycetota bacterium]|jgi:hypothetical protein